MSLTFAQAKIILAKCVDDVSQVEKYRKIRTPIIIREESVVDLQEMSHSSKDPYDPDYILKLEAYAYPDSKKNTTEYLTTWREFFLNVTDRMMKEMGEDVALISYGAKTFPVVRTEK